VSIVSFSDEGGLHFVHQLLLATLVARRPMERHDRLRTHLPRDPAGLPRGQVNTLSM